MEARGQEVRAAIYVRASRDSRDDQASVTRQLEACTALADARQFSVTHTFEDNDISAASKGGRVRHRPGFEALLAAVLDGQVDWVIATKYTRLTRNRTDEVRLVEACQSEGVSLAIVRGSDVDLTTATGRLTAEILASVARHEAEQLGERQVAANEQRTRQGKPHWTRRPFGYNLDGTLMEDEAKLIRQAYDMILEGGTLADVRRRWTEHGGPSTTSSASRIMKNPRNASLRLYNDVPMGRGNWEPIVSEHVFSAVSRLLEGRGVPGPRQRDHLLTGLGLCGNCLDEGVESTLHVGTQSKKHSDGTRRRTYRCSQYPGHLSRSLAPIEKDLTNLTLGLLLGGLFEPQQEDEPELIPLINEMARSAARGARATARGNRMGHGAWHSPSQPHSLTEAHGSSPMPWLCRFCSLHFS